MPTKKQQVDQAERLQQLLLDDFERILKSGEATAADRAVITRFLQNSGWTVDPNDIPQGVRDLLTKHIDPKQFDEDDADLSSVN